MSTVSYDALFKSDVAPDLSGSERELWLRGNDTGTHGAILRGLTRSGCFEGGYFLAEKLLQHLTTGLRYTGARTHKRCSSNTRPSHPHPHTHNCSDMTPLQDEWPVPVGSPGELSPDRVKTPVMRNLITGDVIAKAELAEQQLYVSDEWYCAIRHAPLARTPPL